MAGPGLQAPTEASVSLLRRNPAFLPAWPKCVFLDGPPDLSGCERGSLGDTGQGCPEVHADEHLVNVEG
jgi:hypothetical protein